MNEPTIIKAHERYVLGMLFTRDSNLLMKRSLLLTPDWSGAEAQPSLGRPYSKCRKERDCC